MAWPLTEPPGAQLSRGEITCRERGGKTDSEEKGDGKREREERLRPLTEPPGAQLSLGLASDGATRSPAQPWLGLSRSHPEPSSALAWPLTEPPGAQLSLGKSTWTASETERVRERERKRERQMKRG